MAAYRDANGKDRFIVIDFAGVERVYSRLGIDLYSIGSVGEAAADVRTFLKLVHCLESPDSDFSEWWQAHQGDALDDCVKATLQALENFYPSRLSAMIRTLREDSERAIGEALTIAERELGSKYSESPEPSESQVSAG